MSGLIFGGNGGGNANKTNATQPQAAQGIRIQSSVYGRPITLLYGTNRITANLIWYGNFITYWTTTTTTTGGGGKAGGRGRGGSTSSTTTYTYSAGLMFGLCEGPIAGLLRMWINNDGYAPGAYSQQVGFQLFNGAVAQSPWSFLAGGSQGLGYSGTAYVANSKLDLGSNPSLPNFSFEVMGLLAGGGQLYNAWDCNPATFLPDVLCDPVRGAGWQTSWIDSTSLADYQLYCNAMDFLFSPVFDSQTSAQSVIQDILDSSNSACWWSDGQLKIRPFADTVVSNTFSGWSFTYTPNVTPVFALDDNAFIFTDGSDPIQITRASPADAFNVIDIEFVNRYNDYAPQIAEAKDLFTAQQYGARPDSTRMYHHICEPWTAQTVAQLILQRSVYIRNSYTFTLGWPFCMLEPMDLVTLTDERMGLDAVAVRITSVEENDKGELLFTAEDFPPGVATAPIYDVQAPAGFNTKWNAPADPVRRVVFYEPPGIITNNQLVLWMGVAGIGNWGGAAVWVSLDGLSYVRVGTANRARVGYIQDAMTLVADVDTVNHPHVYLGESAGVLLSGTRADADNFNTLCVIGEELVSYQTAALTLTDTYQLSYLRRGAYKTGELAWPAGTQFMRVDQSVFSYPFDSSMLGKPLYVKLVSFNQYGGGEAELSDVPVYTYTIQGSAINAAPPPVSNLYANYVSGITQLFWTPITNDYRDLDYEIRLGPSWSNATFLTRTKSSTFATVGNGTYWVSTHFRNPNGYDVYSDTPADVLIAGSIIILNNLGTYDEDATFWSGTLTGGAVVKSNQLQLQTVSSITLNGTAATGTVNSVSMPNARSLSGVAALGVAGNAAGGPPATGTSVGQKVVSTGSYVLPAGHEINAKRVTKASVRIDYTGYGQNINDNVLIITDFLAEPDLLDSISGGFVTITPQIAIADATHTYGAWQNYLPGTYVGQYFKAQMLLESRNEAVTALVTQLTFAVDLDLRIDHFTNQAIAAAGTTLTYPNGAYNFGPNGTATPNVQVTVLAAAQGDTVVLSGKTLTQVTVRVLNAGSGVARTVDIIVTGY